MKGRPLRMQLTWKCLLVIAIALIFLLAMFGERENPETEMSPRAFKQIYGETYIRKKPKLLAWTTFFGDGY